MAKPNPRMKQKKLPRKAAIKKAVTRKAKPKAKPIQAPAINMHVAPTLPTNDLKLTIGIEPAHLAEVPQVAQLMQAIGDSINAQPSVQLSLLSIVGALSLQKQPDAGNELV